MVRRKKQEIHVNQERWLVSYADFITLLFAFFVVMYSISQVNQSKYRVLSETFVQAFNPENDIERDTPPPEKLSPSDTLINPIELGKTGTEPATKAPPIVIVEKDTASNTQASPINVEGQVEVNELNQISNQVNEKFSQLINDQLIKVTSNEFWLQIELNDSILFPSAAAEPSEQAQVIFSEIADILKNYKNPIQIEGYTDNVPIKSSRYPTNWELSSARATEIVKWLAAQGVEPERLAAVGYGEFQPIASNDTEEGRAQNRRVAVMVAKRKIERPRALLEQLK